jgi:hypothetical protein
MFQLPPTPTLLPTNVAPPLDVPDISLWDYTDHAIQGWNSALEAGQIFQMIVLVGLVMGLFIVLWRYLANLYQNNQ